MERLQEFKKPAGYEFFSIEHDGKGGKQVHVLGYCYESDDNGDGKDWRNVEYTFFIEPLKEFIKELQDNGDYVDEMAVNVKQYIGDYNGSEMLDVINHYYNGKTANKMLHYCELTEDTPVGDYMFKF